MALLVGQVLRGVKGQYELLHTLKAPLSSKPKSCPAALFKNHGEALLRRQPDKMLTTIAGP